MKQLLNTVLLGKSSKLLPNFYLQYLIAGGNGNSSRLLLKYITPAHITFTDSTATKNNGMEHVWFLCLFA